MNMSDTSQQQRIAIIGSGISGLTCGHLLHKSHHIKLFEANDYIGGHTNTVDVTVNNREYAIDTGFIVFNDWTYPNFIQLMDRLGVAKQATEMSFSVKHGQQNLEYNGNNLNSLFAQRSNVLRPDFWRMLKDIMRFNKLCKAAASSPNELKHLTLGQFIAQHKLGQPFADYYIYPMCSAIWSGSLEDMAGFPMPFFLQFFTHHGLLNITHRPQWYTLIGGSRSYIKPLTQGFREHIHLNSPVQQIKQAGSKWLVQSQNQWEEFDSVIMACHSDQALSLLAQPNSEQVSILEALRYSQNEVVLHTDTSVLPYRKLAWASWNYNVNNNTDNHSATVTYNMNILQKIVSDTTFCVTLNQNEIIHPDKILRTFSYSHPQYDNNFINAQQRRDVINGKDNLYFCGAYWYNGFHEDGVKSALDVCAYFGASL
jgi:predicted NAD/FAD-binding protein